MADAPLRHSTSETLKRVVRRRDRRRKPGANSGEKVYSWAEYGQVNFTPSGAGSIRWLGLMVAGLVGIMCAGYFCLLLFAAADALFSGGSTMGEVLPDLIFLLLPFWLIPLGGWLYVRLDGNTKVSRARLIAAADKLREARDASASGHPPP